MPKMLRSILIFATLCSWGPFIQGQFSDQRTRSIINNSKFQPYASDDGKFEGYNLSNEPIIKVLPSAVLPNNKVDEMSYNPRYYGFFGTNEVNGMTPVLKPNLYFYNTDRIDESRYHNYPAIPGNVFQTSFSSSNLRPTDIPVADSTAPRFPVVDSSYPRLPNAAEGILSSRVALNKADSPDIPKATTKKRKAPIEKSYYNPVCDVFGVASNAKSPVAVGNPNGYSTFSNGANIKPTFNEWGPNIQQVPLNGDTAVAKDHNIHEYPYESYRLHRNYDRNDPYFNIRSINYDPYVQLSQVNLDTDHIYDPYGRFYEMPNYKTIDTGPSMFMPSNVNYCPQKLNPEEAKINSSCPISNIGDFKSEKKEKIETSEPQVIPKWHVLPCEEIPELISPKARNNTYTECVTEPSVTETKIEERIHELNVKNPDAKLLSIPRGPRIDITGRNINRQKAVEDAQKMMDYLIDLGTRRRKLHTIRNPIMKIPLTSTARPKTTKPSLDKLSSEEESESSFYKIDLSKLKKKHPPVTRFDRKKIFEDLVTGKNDVINEY